MEQQQESPRHEHDCDRCAFLGRFGDADLYFHPSDYALLRTVVARKGPCQNYVSGMVFSAPYVSLDGKPQPGIPELVEAKRRAAALGYLSA